MKCGKRIGVSDCTLRVRSNEAIKKPQMILSKGHSLEWEQIHSGIDSILYFIDNEPAVKECLC
jgi:hypothetical protein